MRRCCRSSRIIQSPCVEPSASARASLEKHVGKRRRQPRGEIVHAEHTLVRKRALTISERLRIELGNTAVEVPFDIRNFVGGQNIAYRRKDMIDDLFAGKVEHQLVAVPTRLDARFADAQSGCARYKSLSSLTPSGSNHKPNRIPFRSHLFISYSLFAYVDFLRFVTTTI